jgi:integrase
MSAYRRKWKDKKTGKIRLGSYYFKFDLDGETYKETVKTARTMKQAEEAERQFRQDLHEGRYGVKSKKQLFSTFVNEVYLPYVEQNNKRLDHYQQHAKMLCQYFEGRHLKQISSFAVETFKRDRMKTPTRYNKKRSPRTVNSEMGTLSGILSLAVTHKLLRENSCSGVKWLDSDDLPTKRIAADEEKALLMAAEADYWFLKPMIQLALWTSFRQGELIALSQSAIDFSHNRIYVFNPKWRKDKRKTQGVPMSAEVRELLLRLCEEARGDLLFPDSEGKKLKRHIVYCAFKRACERAGISGLRFHDLRHEYGSRLGDADVNLKKIMQLMGHANTRQTERYVHPDDEELVAATEIAAQGRTRIVPERLRAVK